VFNNETFDYDSKIQSYSKNSRTSRQNDIYDIDEKAYESYFKDKESYDIPEKFAFLSKRKESMDIDEKFHTLLKHRGSFDVDHKDFNKFENSEKAHEFQNVAPRIDLDEGILNLKIAAEDLNSNILMLERRHKICIVEPPVQFMDLRKEDVNIHFFSDNNSRAKQNGKDKDTQAQMYDCSGQASLLHLDEVKKRRHSWSEDHVLLKSGTSSVIKIETNGHQSKKNSEIYQENPSLDLLHSDLKNGHNNNFKVNKIQDGPNLENCNGSE